MGRRTSTHVGREEEKDSGRNQNKDEGGKRKQRRGNMLEIDAQTHTPATALQDVQFNQIPSTNKQVQRQDAFFHLSTRSLARPVNPASADLHSLIPVLKSFNVKTVNSNSLIIIWHA